MTDDDDMSGEVDARCQIIRRANGTFTLVTVVSDLSEGEAVVLAKLSYKNMGSMILEAIKDRTTDQTRVVVTKNLPTEQ